MDKKISVVAICLLLGLGISLGWFYFASRMAETTKEGQISPEKNLPSRNLKEYQNEAGFAFSYPEDLTITNREVSDSVTYADIMITSPKVSGQITLKIADSKLKSLEEWWKGDKKEITLAGIPAWEVERKDGLSTAALDQGVLFILEVSPQNEEDFWLSVYKTLVSSFAFITPETKDGVSADAGGDVIFEGEEIIE